MLKALALFLALASNGWAVCPANVLACYFCTATADASDLCGGSPLTVTGTLTYDAIAGPTVNGIVSTSVSGWSALNYATMPAAIQAVMTSTAKNNYSVEAYGQIPNYSNFYTIFYNNAAGGNDFFGLENSTGKMQWNSSVSSIVSTTPVGQNAWKNLAWDFNGTTRTFYNNGAQDGTSATGATWQNGAIQVGAFVVSFAWAGQISRIVIQTASSSVHPAVITNTSPNTDKRGLSLRSVLRMDLKP